MLLNKTNENNDICNLDARQNRDISTHECTAKKNEIGKALIQEKPNVQLAIVNT